MNISLIGNGTFFDCSDALARADAVIAVDGGTNHCMRMNTVPDIILGDGDSVTQETDRFFADVAREELRNQHFSDLQKALSYVKSRYGKNKKSLQVDLYCFTSTDRFDHSLVPLFLMATDDTMDIRLYGSNWTARYLHAGKHIIDTSLQRTISIFSFGDVSGVRSVGLQWEVSDVVLQERLFSLSNIATTDNCQITIGSGGLFFIQSAL